MSELKILQMNNSAGSSSELVMDGASPRQEGAADAKQETPLRELLGNPKITFVLGKSERKHTMIFTDDVLLLNRWPRIWQGDPMRQTSRGIRLHPHIDWGPHAC